MPNRFILILVLVILTACASNQPKTVNEPDWFLSVPSNPDTVYATGVDEKSEIFAVADALFSIAYAVEANISGLERRSTETQTSGYLDKRYEFFNETIVDFKVGDISVNGMIKMIRDSTKAGDLTSNLQTYEIISSNFLIRSAFEEINDKTTVDERSSSTVNINDLISELKKSGATVQLERKDNLIFCLIGIPKDLEGKLSKIKEDSNLLEKLKN